MRVLRLLAAPWLRSQARKEAARQPGSPAVDKPITVRYHCCPQCTEMLPRNPAKAYYYCPLCGHRIDYPDGDGYGLHVVTATDLSQYTRLHKAAERMSLILAGSDR